MVDFLACLPDLDRLSFLLLFLDDYRVSSLRLYPLL